MSNSRINERFKRKISYLLKNRGNFMNRISLFKTRIVIEDKVYLLAKDVRKALGYKSIEQLHGEYPEIVKHVKDLPALVLESDFNMEQIYPLYKEADVVVLASPLYYWFISGFLKNAFDRLFAIAECDSNYRNPKKLCFRRTGWKGFECRCGSYEEVKRQE